MKVSKRKLRKIVKQINKGEAEAHISVDEGDVFIAHAAAITEDNRVIFLQATHDLVVAMPICFNSIVGGDIKIVFLNSTFNISLKLQDYVCK